LALVARWDAELYRADPALMPAPNSREVIEALLNQSVADRLHAVETHIRNAWRDGEETWQEIGGKSAPNPLPEHLQPSRTLGDNERDPTELGQDTTSVMLARLRIPVDASPGVVPTDREEDPFIDNPIRRFVYAPGVITQYP
jgi:hypothetical protein